MFESVFTYARTLEKSADGDITKLSALADHDIRCCMLGSSSMLNGVSYNATEQCSRLLLTCTAYV